MNSDISGYDLRESLAIAAVASLCPIFLFLFLAYISYHPVFNTTTIDEILDYGKIFLLSTLSYFASALIACKWGNVLARKMPIWVPVSFIGSFFFVAIFTGWEFANLALGRVHEQSNGAVQIGWWMFVSSFFLSIITSIFTAIASCVYGLLINKHLRPAN